MFSDEEKIAARLGSPLAPAARPQIVVMYPMMMFEVIYFDKNAFKDIQGPIEVFLTSDELSWHLLPKRTTLCRLPGAGFMACRLQGRWQLASLAPPSMVPHSLWSNQVECFAAVSAFLSSPWIVRLTWLFACLSVGGRCMTKKVILGRPQLDSDKKETCAVVSRSTATLK